MSNHQDPLAMRRSMTVAILVFTAAFAVHGLDHLRRGMAASPPSIMVGGTIQGLFVAVALVLVLRRHRWASQAAIVVGFGSALVFTYAHVLATFLPGYQDSFSSGPRVNVTWFSWLTAVGEIGAGLVLGYVGLQARRRPTADLVTPGRPNTP
ncbi:MAG TPA: hypothetical protein VMS84_03010 [Mycobacterium sp.]|jgi:hypothetical protein|nr:hypothetical protein [Mycobacterium sp.]